MANRITRVVTSNGGQGITALATGEPQPVWQRETDTVTQATKKLNDHLPPSNEFILPRGGQAAAFAHVARSSVRRAERVFWKHASDSLKESGLVHT